MKTKKIKPLLFLIFLVTVIPTIYIYLEHASVELDAYEKAKTETKKTKTLSEAVLFAGIGIGYIISIVAIFYFPKSSIPYLVIIVGTVTINFLYYFRIYGIPIPFTDGIVITDLTTDWRDVVTKICQQILVIPVTALLIIRNNNK